MRKIQSRDSLQASTSAAPMRFIGRQPILDLRGKIYGYEMLFRTDRNNVFSGDAEDASRDVIDHCLLLMPNPRRELTFINCTKNVLMTGMVTLLPPASTVLEILEDIDPEPELMKACWDLKKKGYRFALDDFSPDESKLPFLEIADFIKIDFLAADARKRREIYALTAQTKATLLAEKVETEADVQRARSEGCTLFQGYFFSKPTVVRTTVIPQNYVIYLQLFAALNRAPADISEIEQLVSSDASLCYRLLRLVNSTIYALPTEVSSIRSALMLVGDDEFRKMVTVAVAGLAASTHSEAALHLALERARFCELLAPSMNESASRLYLLGMLSVIDVILGMPMKQILNALPLDHEMKAALLGGRSSLSVALDFARCHESGDLHEHAQIQQALGITNDAASMICVDALQWADKAARATL